MDNMIGQRIKERRKELKITQTQIQQKTSISSGNLSCIENGKYLPSAMALLELSEILNCSVDWILTGKSSISEKTSFSDNKEYDWLPDFALLSNDDKSEIIAIIELKLARQQKTRKTSVKSSPSTSNETDNMVG